MDVFIEGRQDDVVCVYYTVLCGMFYRLDSVMDNASDPGRTISPRAVHQPAKQTPKPPQRYGNSVGKELTV